MKRFFACSLMVAAALADAAASTDFSLNYFGVTSDDSSQDGTSIPTGTAFEVHALFDSIPVEAPEAGIAFYLPTSISMVLGGVTSTGLFDSGDYFILILDSSNPLFSGGYLPVLAGDGSGGFGPGYLTAVPPIIAANLNPTEFSEYQGALGNSFTINTDRGATTVTFSQEAGVRATITAVPEPAAYAATAGLALLGFGVWRRRFAV